jgi:hypothetical protein
MTRVGSTGAGGFPAAARRWCRRALARLAETPLARRRHARVVECPREDEVFEAIAFGRWAERRDAELAAHAAACRVCGDLVAVARALHDDRDAACREAHPPAAGTVWWRATIRARAEAARTAMRPITVLQAVAAACVAGATAALATVAWRTIHAADRLGDLVSQFASGRGDLVAATSFGVEHALMLVVGLAACLVLAPLALYFTLADD